jgi:hypothetical protein
VYFSSDNEQLSRTFAEMLGLDTGWNCYISLSDESKSFDKENVKELVESAQTTKRNVKKFQGFSPNSLHSNESNTNLVKNASFYQSLPSLKLLKSKSSAYSSSHSVKFNLKNLRHMEEKIHEEELVNDELNNQNDDIEKMVLIQKSSSKKFNSAINSATNRTNQDEEILSHRTACSERTLSETDVLDNAVYIH